MAEQHNILVILGHPAAGSLCAGMARAYAEGARHAGAQVRFLDVGQLAFNPCSRAMALPSRWNPTCWPHRPTSTGRTT